jgi:predicted nucleic acid-binding protein
MIAYVDSSIVLRIVLHQPHTLAEWPELTFPITSELTAVECARTLDRHRLAGLLDAPDLRRATQLVATIMSRMTVLDLTPDVIRRVMRPLPTPVGTLDAVHLTTALLYRETQGILPTFATHDHELAEAARALGFATLGS